jgi:DNA-binding Xre family transcriptional regulator
MGLNVKERVLKWMEIKGIKSVNELALRGEMTQSTLQNLMSFPDRKPRADTIEKICLGLGVTVSEFWALPDLVDMAIAEAEKMPKTEKEKAALERLKSMPRAEQERRILEKYNSLSPEQREAINVILHSLAPSQQ